MIRGRQNGETIILIPSLEPDERLPAYVRQLREYGFTNIVIVDDGSGEAYQSIFEELREDGCALLTHAENQGRVRHSRPDLSILVGNSTHLPSL